MALASCSTRLLLDGAALAAERASSSTESSSAVLAALLHCRLTCDSGSVGSSAVLQALLAVILRPTESSSAFPVGIRSGVKAPPDTAAAAVAES
jgi:hypothetical protein